MRSVKKLNGGIGLCILLAITSNSSIAQTTDSTEKEGFDSTTIYKKIQSIAYKHKFTTLIYHAVFVEPKPIEYPSKPASKEEKIVNPYLKYEGKVIKKINITVFDPFGHSITEMMPFQPNFFERVGNRAHRTTRHWVINNKLLFKPNDTINAIALSESERLLREAVYINDARIFISNVKRTDSVIVNIIVQDKWTITVPGELTKNTGNLRYRNQNLLGLGQQYEQYVGAKRPDYMEYSGFYNISNIDNTYISSQLSYHTDNNGTQVGVSFDRPFYSPLAKWAGGVSVSHAQNFYDYTDSLDYNAKRVSVTHMDYDVWLGKTIKLNRTKSFFNQSTNIVVGGRYYTTIYLDRPKVANDIIKTNPNLWAYVGNVGFAVQQYYKDRFIYRFGANEDVPEGFILQYLYGAEKREMKPLRYYSAIEFARAKHFDFGYVTFSTNHSIFFNKYTSNDITHNYHLYYFSDLYRLGRWYMRDFVNWNWVYGVNKPAEEQLTIKPEDMYGFNSGSLKGSKKMTGNIEAVAYAPYNLIGFRFAGVALIGVGMMGDKERKLRQSNLYQAYSIGLMVRNENLLTSTFQISVGMYPFLPDHADYVLVYNPVVSFTLRVRAFSVSKPAFISY